MNVDATEIPEVLVIAPRIFSDSRGFFVEMFKSCDFNSVGIVAPFVQDNHSRSKKGVLRGLHYQIEQPQGKLVNVIRGRIYDVAVDIRRGSPTFGKWIGIVLDDEQRQSLWIPPGFAHGFCTLSFEADVVYKCTDYYNPNGERGILWNDPLLDIDWPLDNPVVSDKDARYSVVSSDRNDLPIFGTAH